jgi:hypothetical protein
LYLWWFEGILFGSKGDEGKMTESLLASFLGKTRKGIGGGDYAGELPPALHIYCVTS